MNHPRFTPPQPLAAYARIVVAGDGEDVYHTVQSGAFEPKIRRRRIGRYSLKLDKHHGKDVRDLLRWGLAHVFVIPTHRTNVVMVERIDLKLPRIEIRLKSLAGHVDSGFDLLIVRQDVPLVP